MDLEPVCRVEHAPLGVDMTVHVAHEEAAHLVRVRARVRVRASVDVAHDERLSGRG